VLRLPLFIALTLAFGCGDDDDGGAAIDSGMTDSAVSIDAAGPADAAPARTRLMYVSIGQEARLAVVELGADGTMTAQPTLDDTLPGNGRAMAYARNTRRLYMGVGSGSLATLSLDTAGAPTLLGTSTLPATPVYVATTADESIVITAYFGGNEVLTHDASGAPPHAELDSIDTDEEPHAAFVGPGGLVYVPHRTGGTTHWYSVDTQGTLSLQSQLASDPGVGPRHIAFSADGSFAYVINEFADTVSAHTVASDGTLARFQTLPTIPGAFDGSTNTCADVHVTPDGRFLYGSNRGHDSIAMFSIGVDGSLTALGNAFTEARPREFDVSPDGRFVVVAGQDSGFLQSFRVETNGMLTMVDRLQVGNDLRWVIID
jgi:6-phosphogluconolactonase